VIYSMYTVLKKHPQTFVQRVAGNVFCPDGPCVRPKRKHDILKSVCNYNNNIPVWMCIEPECRS